VYDSKIASHGSDGQHQAQSRPRDLRLCRGLIAVIPNHNPKHTTD
jgi:hypothetical protein